MTIHDPMSERFVETRAGRLYARAYGPERGPTGAPKRPLVLWPSIFTDQKIYGPLRALLRDQRFILIDGPGHGQSGPPPEGLTMENCGEAMLAVMDAFAIEKAILGGTSWGGITAAHAALAAPDRAEALVLLNTPMHMGEGAPALVTRLIASGARWVPGLGTFRNGVARGFFADPSLQAHPEFGAAFHGMLKRAKGRALGEAVRAVFLRASPLAPRLKDINAPTLIVAGEDDAMYPLQEQKDAAASLWAGSFEVVPGKHISAIDAPGPVAAALTRFLAEHSALT